MDTTTERYDVFPPVREAFDALDAARKDLGKRVGRMGDDVKRYEYALSLLYVGYTAGIVQPKPFDEWVTDLANEYRGIEA